VLASALLGVGMVLVMGTMVGAVPDAVAGGFGSVPAGRFRDLVVLVVALWILGQFLDATREAALGILGSRVSIEVMRRLRGIANGPPGIAHLEDPQLQDQRLRVMGAGTGIPGAMAVVTGLRVLSLWVGSAGSLALLFGLRWWMPLLVGGLFLRARADTNRLLADLWRNESTVAQMRRAHYFHEQALGIGAAKEVRIFGAGRWLVDRYATLHGRALDELLATRRGLRLALVRASVTVGIGVGAVLLVIVLDTRSGILDVGQLAIYTGAAMSATNLAGASDWDQMFAMARSNLEGLSRMQELASPAALGQPVLPAALPPGAPARGVSFEGVAFAYPGTDREVFAGLDLELVAGQSLAIVGLNGAGKTTLIKLLTRLYDPTAGRIVVDGVDLVDLDPAAWRARVGVIFQDYVRYALPLRDNVALGAARREVDDGRVLDALRRAGAGDLVDRLPHGLETILSRRYERGTDLSGGQWQRVALARALYAAGDGGLLVLDEPTAHQDVRAEARLFDRFLDLTGGVTTVLISHRFSTVRRADRIAVIEEGRITELGTHDELMARRATYQRMFSLQASRFDDGVDVRIGAPHE